MMKNRKNNLKKILRKMYETGIDILNKTLPKHNRIIVVGNHTIEDNAVALADYIAKHTEIPVYYELSEKFFSPVSKWVSPKVQLVDSSKKKACLWRALTSQYIYYTYPYRLAYFSSSKRQKLINVWHGVGHKKIGKARGVAGMPADYTIATSELTKKMLAIFFDVPEKSMVITGYPRNDWMLQAQKKKEHLKEAHLKDLQKYNRIIIWMPTYRRIKSKDSDRIPTGQKINLDHVFQVEDFKVQEFNELLRKHQTLCLVKPHQLYQLENEETGLTNIKFIDNNWIYDKNLSLYQFLACTDALITDYSSVMTDYSLLEQPIFCFSTDLENYKKNNSLYFEDFENWIPSRHLKNQEEFFKEIEQFLITGEDAYESQRQKIRDVYFQYKDTNSSQRIVEYIIK